MSNRSPDEQGPTPVRTTRPALLGALGVAVALIAAILVATRVLGSHGARDKASAPFPTRAAATAMSDSGGRVTATSAAGGQATATGSGGIQPAAATTTGPTARPTGTPRPTTRATGSRRATPAPINQSTPAGTTTSVVPASPASPTDTGAAPSAATSTSIAPATVRPTTPVGVGSTHTSVATATHTSSPAPVATPSRPAPTATRTRVATRAPTATITPAVTRVPTLVATRAPTATITPRASLMAAYRDYTVGAYYFSGWSHGQNDNISAILTGPHRGAEPLIGWYDDSQAQVNKSIDQAANAGVNFFSFDWYDIPYSPYATDRTLNEGLMYYLTSARRSRLGFNLVFVDHAPFVPTPDHPAAIASWRTTEWPRIIDQWLPLFKQPDYVRVDGKPLLTVFSPEHMREICGGSTGVRAALDYLRARVRAAGLPGVTVAVAATVAAHSNPIKAQELNDEGYDAATGYNYHSLGNEQYRKPVPYSQLVAENRATWDRVAAAVHVPYMPVITSGWDQRYSAREQQTAIIYTGRTPRQFACYAVDARHWIDTHPTQTTKERIVMIFAWNEIGEGGAIIPSYQDGFAYANTVGTIFGTTTSPPQTPVGCT